MSKYKHSGFCRWHPLVKDLEALNEALCKAVQYDNVLETMQLLHSGAQVREWLNVPIYCEGRHCRL